MALGKMFLVEYGTFVVIRNEIDEEVSFSSFAEFYKYCPTGEFSVDLTGKTYIGYEPDRPESPIYIDDGTDLSGDIPNASFEGLISNLDVVKSRVDDPYYGMTLQEAKDYKKEVHTNAAFVVITNAWPIYQQLNLNAGIADSGDKTQKDTDVLAVRTECDTREVEIDACTTVAQVKAVTPTWPVI